MHFIFTKALRTGLCVSKTQPLGASFPLISTVLVKMTEVQGIYDIFQDKIRAKRSAKLHYCKPSF